MFAHLIKNVIKLTGRWKEERSVMVMTRKVLYTSPLASHDANMMSLIMAVKRAVQSALVCRTEEEKKGVSRVCLHTPCLEVMGCQIGFHH